MSKHTLDSQHTSVSASITLAVLHAASRLGVDRAQLMSACELHDSQLSDPDARVPFATQEQLWQHLSRIKHTPPPPPAPPGPASSPPKKNRGHPPPPLGRPPPPPRPGAHPPPRPGPGFGM